MRTLIQRTEQQLIRRRFTDISGLTTQLYDALVEYLNITGKIRHLPFDESECPGASLDDISEEKIAWFLPKAREERKFSVKKGSAKESVLEHLNLLSGTRPKY